MNLEEKQLSAEYMYKGKIIVCDAIKHYFLTETPLRARLSSITAAYVLRRLPIMTRCCL